MNVNLLLKDDQPDILMRLMKARKTSNRNQVLREALYEYAEKILGDFTHERVTERGNDHESRESQV